MSIISFIKRISVQTIVYWGTPVADAFGGYTYDDPIEIKGRWEDKLKIINNTKGEEFITNSQILTNEDLTIGGMVYLGTLDELNQLDIDLESGETYLLPRQVIDAYKIVTRDRIPLVRSTTKFVKIYYLKPNWETKV